MSAGTHGGLLILWELDSLGALILWIHRYSKSPDMEPNMCYMWWFELGAPHIFRHLNIWFPVNDTVPWFRRYDLYWGKYVTEGRIWAFKAFCPSVCSVAGFLWTASPQTITQ